MADILTLSRLVGGLVRNVDITSNTPVVLSIKVGGSVSNTELTKTILDRLVALQNGTDVGSGFHTHDTLYTRSSALAATTIGSAGSTLIGDNNSYTNFTPGAATVKGALQAIDSVLGTAANALDGSFRIRNTSDITKQIAFSAATITAGNTRTITMPDANVNLGDVNTSIQQSGSRAFTAAQSMGGFALTNVADPVNPQDAMTLNKAQQLLAGIDWKQHVRAYSAANLTLSGAQTVDGVSLIAGDRILVANQTASTDNGIYVVASSTWSRSSDANTGAGLVAASVYVDEGTSFGGTAWVQTAAAPITIGTTAIAFAKFASVVAYIFRNGLVQTGQNIDVVPGDASLLSTVGSLVVQRAAAGAITLAGDGIQVATDGFTTTITTNKVVVKLDAAGAITSSASGVKVNTDGSTVGINGSNQVYIPNAGVTKTQINSNVADQATITGGAGSSLAVQYAPAMKLSFNAGETMAANTSFAVRFALNGETASELYKADQDATTTNNFFAIGFALAASSTSAGSPIMVSMGGIHTLGSADTPFNTSDLGLPVWLTAAGAFSTTAPTTANYAAYQLGIVISTTQILVKTQLMGIN
jgi:hypothetical protein